MAEALADEEIAEIARKNKIDDLRSLTQTVRCLEAKLDDSRSWEAAERDLPLIVKELKRFEKALERLSPCTRAALGIELPYLKDISSPYGEVPDTDLRQLKNAVDLALAVATQPGRRGEHVLRSIIEELWKFWEEDLERCVTLRHDRDAIKGEAQLRSSFEHFVCDVIEKLEPDKVDKVHGTFAAVRQERRKKKPR